MCKAIEELIEKRAWESVLEWQKDAAKRIIARGKETLEEIAEDLNLPIEVVEELANSQPV